MPSDDKPARGFREDPRVLFAAALGEQLADRSPSNALAESELAGQGWLCGQDAASDCLVPSRVDDNSRAMLERSGAKFLGVVEDDPLFQRARFPTGWRFRPTEDARYSALVDAEGNTRAVIWFKSVFYDRTATMTARPVAGSDQSGSHHAR